MFEWLISFAKDFVGVTSVFGGFGTISTRFAQSFLGGFKVDGF